MFLINLFLCFIGVCVGGLDTRIAQKVCASSGAAGSRKGSAVEDFGDYGN